MCKISLDFLEDILFLFAVAVVFTGHRKCSFFILHRIEIDLPSVTKLQLQKQESPPAVAHL
jgi:hypothetical protein